jgi:glycine dehydrogenase subunit 2
MGFDIMHINLHKTFAAPHGGGGPGSGPIGVVKRLQDFLPKPIVRKQQDRFFLDYGIKFSVGRMRSFYGNVLPLIKAYVYILLLGKEGLRRVSEYAVLNANYIKEQLKAYYTPAVDKGCMHEVVFSCASQSKSGVKAYHIAKRLIDYKIHPPTVYFPLIVKEALMIEPTETEDKAALDRFIKAMIEIACDVEKNPDFIRNAPHNTYLSHLDEARAARFPDLRWQKNTGV